MNFLKNIKVDNRPIQINVQTHIKFVVNNKIKKMLVPTCEDRFDFYCARFQKQNTPANYRILRV